MRKLSIIAMIGTALLLGACAQLPYTVGECSGKSICPIVIYEKSANVFGTLPDHMRIKSDRSKNYPTIIFTFADQTRYEFVANTSTTNGDGVELIGANGAKIGFAPCYITKNSRVDVSFAPKGPYLRCEVRDSATFASTKYRVRFHGVDGSEKMVDPTVDSSGSGDLLTAAAAPASYQELMVNVGDNVHVPVIGGSTGVAVTWDAGQNGLFDSTQGDFLVFKDSVGNDVNIQPCYVSKDAKGATLDATGRYFYCLVTTTMPSFNYKYDAQYRVSATIQTAKDKEFIRP